MPGVSGAAAVSRSRVACVADQGLTAKDDTAIAVAQYRLLETAQDQTARMDARSQRPSTTGMICGSPASS
jgi:hypothetical protein